MAELEEEEINKYGDDRFIWRQKDYGIKRSSYKSLARDLLNHHPGASQISLDKSIHIIFVLWYNRITSTKSVAYEMIELGHHKYKLSDRPIDEARIRELIRGEDE